MPRRMLVGTGALVLSLTTLSIAPAATAAPSGDDPASRFERTAASTSSPSGYVPRGVDSTKRVTVVVELKGDPVAVVQAEKGRELTASERSSIKKDLRKNQQTVADDLTARGGEIQATMQSAYNGIQVSIPAKQLDEVAELPNVVGVHAVQRYTVDNATSVPFLGVPQVWQDTGYAGKGVKVAIIDTGIDYTHADFGGPGTVEAFEEAAAASTSDADPALFGPEAPRVKGGYDFVGDDYDADSDDPAIATPVPDTNPLDCNGHGSHVAGTTGGSGVTADGDTYAGPYDATTSSNDFLVGPGVAPEVDLYALRVFGCEGSTDVTVAAIDWAVDNGMDVINMSLGAPFGRADDPTAVAASNAVGAGVVVVASAGNSGHNPYIVGSPGSANGVISVAAVDSSETFPGASLSFDGQELTGVNANGADLSGRGQLTIVPVGTADEATGDFTYGLGCSAQEFTDAFEAAGVSESDNVVAVVSRGTCARVAKAIFGQQAGADAVVMVNTSEALPPYEGRITSNPDDGTPYEVTIPFIGVELGDGPALAAAAGEDLTLASVKIENPGYRQFADFTSGGPRNGDSAIGVDVSAPGVSIASAGVGTGNGAAINSGTSMASPHVAGVAALTVQAHPGWSSEDLAAAVVSTANPDKVSGQDPRLGGVGLVDAAQAVSTTVTVTGDGFKTDSGWLRESALSFGFAEASKAFLGAKTITIENHGSKPVTYQLSSEESASSSTARVTFSQRSVRVPARGKAKVVVVLSAAASGIGSSIGDDQFAHYEISGDVVLTSGSSELRVPYLLVPRATTNVVATTGGGGSPWFSVKTKGVKTPTQRSITLRNPMGALDGVADFYTWGLSDGRDVAKGSGGGGYDLRAVGVQSFADGDDQLMVFAVNNYDRASNAAVNEFDVSIDTDGDSNADWIVFSADSGALRTGTNDGLTEVGLYEVATGQVSLPGFLASAPTDSSTVLLPVYASWLGLSADAGTFSYSVAAYSVEGDFGDEIDGSATYNPWTPALGNGQYETVPRNGKITVDVAVDPTAWLSQKPLGTMVVALDNAAGKDEALLVRGR